MTQELGQIWVYLSASPLLGLTITLLAYQGAYGIYQRTGCNPLANPVLIAVAVLVLFLLGTGTSYETYFAGAQFVHFLLGPATVALAIPLYTQFKRVRAMWLPALAGLIAGSLTAIVSAVAIGQIFGASKATQLSLAPKSVTTPIAMGIAEQIGGQPSLAAVFVLLTGLIASILAVPLLRRIGINDWRALGLAAGTAGHGLATAQILLQSETAGAFGGLAIGLNGILTALIVPPLAAWLSPF